jgi:hypothetical protein
VIVENRGGDPVPAAIFFENRSGRLGYRVVGAVQKAITLDPLPLRDALPQLLSDLERILVEQGLYAKEAHAMIERGATPGSRKARG